MSDAETVPEDTPRGDIPERSLLWNAGDGIVAREMSGTMIRATDMAVPSDERMVGIILIHRTALRGDPKNLSPDHAALCGGTR